jgi:hypothetical protein
MHFRLKRRWQAGIPCHRTRRRTALDYLQRLRFRLGESSIGVCDVGRMKYKGDFMSSGKRRCFIILAILVISISAYCQNNPYAPIPKVSFGRCTYVFVHKSYYNNIYSFDNFDSPGDSSFMVWTCEPLVKNDSLYSYNSYADSIIRYGQLQDWYFEAFNQNFIATNFIDKCGDQVILIGPDGLLRGKIDAIGMLGQSMVCLLSIENQVSPKNQLHSLYVVIRTKSANSYNAHIYKSTASDDSALSNFIEDTKNSFIKPYKDIDPNEEGGPCQGEMTLFSYKKPSDSDLLFLTADCNFDDEGCVSTLYLLTKKDNRWHRQILIDQNSDFAGCSIECSFDLDNDGNPEYFIIHYTMPFGLSPEIYTIIDNKWTLLLSGIFRYFPQFQDQR